MNETLYVRTDYRDFEHGEISAEPTDRNSVEWNVQANVELVVSRDDVESFKEELEELLKKYAL